ncbi:hypothetical protein BD779DRAFT_1677702 [Infundibulicybe gibba]|nr:hypothetical protein BD779DRAFT_1677702 [Infundibulicybe gibba]
MKSRPVESHGVLIPALAAVVILAADQTFLIMASSIDHRIRVMVDTEQPPAAETGPELGRIHKCGLPGEVAGLPVERFKRPQADSAGGILIPNANVYDYEGSRRSRALRVVFVQNGATLEEV